MYEKELQNLGLSEKEAKVYTTALELGPDTVQNIAKQSGINRATTYVQIGTLKEKGLMSEFEKGKKTYFVAESPEILSSLVNKEEVALNFKKLELTRVLPDLTKFFSKGSPDSEKPKIRYFEGEEGIAQIRADFLKTKNETIYGFMNFDQVVQRFMKKQEDYTRKRIQNKIYSKLIYTSKGKDRPQSDPEKLRELKFVSPEKFPFDADITIYRNKVAIISYKSDAVGIIIENKAFADTMKSIFFLIWDQI